MSLTLRVALGREVPTAFVEKLRANGVVSGGTLVGAVEGRLAVIVDDLIGTGSTVRQAVRACMRNGAQSVVAAATHGVFVGSAPEMLNTPALDGLFIANTIPPFRLDGTPAAEKVTVCDAAPRVARAIEAIHTSGSVTSLNAIDG